MRYQSFISFIGISTSEKTKMTVSGHICIDLSISYIRMFFIYYIPRYKYWLSSNISSNDSVYIENGAELEQEKIISAISPFRRYSYKSRNLPKRLGMYRYIF